ncbi:hypothetical protein PAPYR_6267 [Paratrimastix pyriformis]|uniref:Uncharacterized protein n=1 Tax=Paratrimastix pyriformis TaxID=342808 RepID=A0ABQ8UN27_9EUKA|nr:hypothetical protein PAPYR_6267 [Paratrimastix pyriformis]
MKNKGEELYERGIILQRLRQQVIDEAAKKKQEEEAKLMTGKPHINPSPTAATAPPSTQSFEEHQRNWLHKKQLWLEAERKKLEEEAAKKIAPRKLVNKTSEKILAHRHYANPVQSWEKSFVSFMEKRQDPKPEPNFRPHINAYSSSLYRETPVSERLFQLAREKQLRAAAAGAPSTTRPATAGAVSTTRRQTSQSRSPHSGSRSPRSGSSSYSSSGSVSTSGGSPPADGARARHPQQGEAQNRSPAGMPISAGQTPRSSTASQRGRGAVSRRVEELFELASLQEMRRQQAILEDQQAMPFRPRIDPHSERIARQLHRVPLHAQTPARPSPTHEKPGAAVIISPFPPPIHRFHPSNPINLQPQPGAAVISPRRLQDFISRNLGVLQVTEEKRRRLQEMIDAQERQDCTFRPRVLHPVLPSKGFTDPSSGMPPPTPTSTSAAATRTGTGPDDDYDAMPVRDGTAPTANPDTNINTNNNHSNPSAETPSLVAGQRMYQKAVASRRALARRRQAEQERQLEAELKECTFTPATSTNCAALPAAAAAPPQRIAIAELLEFFGAKLRQFPAGSISRQ